MGQHGAVAHARIEYPQRRRHWVKMFDLALDPLRHYPLLVAGGNKQKIFLPVIVKSKRFVFHDRHRPGFLSKQF